DQLHIEVPLPERALAGFANGRECRHQQIVERDPFRDLLAEFIGASAQLIVAQSLELFFQSVDRIDARLETADATIVGRAKQLTRGGTEHAGILSRRNSAIGQSRPIAPNSAPNREGSRERQLPRCSRRPGAQATTPRLPQCKARFGLLKGTPYCPAGRTG